MTSPSLVTATAALLCGAMAVSHRAAVAQEVGGSCGGCHRDLEEERLSTPAVVFADDVHGRGGFACTSCHGGDARTNDPDISHLGMRARPPRTGIPAVCGRCHSNLEFMRRFNPNIRSDQVTSYWTSRHGERLRNLGDANVATCIDCHSSHSILPPTEEASTVHPLRLPELCGSCHADRAHMSDYDIPTDQLDEYQKSVHWSAVTDGGDLSAPVCNDCHGNHGAVPPGYSAVGNVCAECHFQIGEYYSRSPHDSAFARAEKPACATCHSNHNIRTADDELLGLGEEATCRGSGCHSEADEGGRAAEAMLALIDSLRLQRARADSILLAAEHAGMPVDQAQFELTQVTSALVGARAVMHMARLDSVSARIEEGLDLTSRGYEVGQAAFRELEVRRTGLAVFSSIVLVLVVGLLIRIHQLGRAD